MAWFRIRELPRNWFDTESKLRIVAVRRDSQLQEELDFGTSEVLYALAILQAGEVNQLNYESVSWCFPVPSSDFLHETRLRFEPHFVIVDGIGEHHWHRGAHNCGTGKHVECL